MYRSDAAGQPGCRERKQSVGEEEDDLREQGLCIIEAEGCPQCDDERVVVGGDEAPREEERGDRREGEKSPAPALVGGGQRDPQRKVATEPVGMVNE